MTDSTIADPALSRRDLLRGGLIAGAAVAVLPVLPAAVSTAATALGHTFSEDGPATIDAASTAATTAQLDRFTVATFAPLIDSRFEIVSRGRSVTAALVVADDLGDAYGWAGPTGRRPFSLLFEASGADLPQGTYRVDHPELGTMDILLVPVGPLDGSLVTYEAIFG